MLIHASASHRANPRGASVLAEFNDQAATSGTLLHTWICNTLEHSIQQLQFLSEVDLLTKAAQSSEADATHAARRVSITDHATFASTPALHEEQLGPVTLIVTTETPSEFLKAANLLEGQLTATLHLSGTDEEHAPH